MSATLQPERLEERLQALYDENVRLARENAKVRRMAATMREAGIALGESLDLDEVLESVLDYLCDLIPSDSCAVMLLDQQGFLAVRAARGFSDTTTQLKIRFRLGELPHLDRVIQGAIPNTVHCRDACLDWRTVPGDQAIQSWLGVPLVSRGRVIGCISLNGYTTSRFHQGHIRTAETLASQAALAIDNATQLARSSAALSKAETGSAAKSWSITSLSSQLRTPLSSIAGFAEMWLEEARELPTDLVADLGHILTASHHATRVIEQLRDLRAIEQQQLELQRNPVDVRTLVEELVMSLRPLANEHHNQMTIQQDEVIVIQGDAVRVRTVLAYLIDNACRYTRGGTVGIDVHSMGDSVRIRVQDNGIGLPPPHQTEIFEAFVRGDRAGSLHPNGSGLGLPLARQLARAMGGDLMAGGLPGRGSIFDFTLPTGGLQSE